MGQGDAVLQEGPSAVRDRLTAEALAEVERGQVVDHRVVCAWVDSVRTGSVAPSVSGLGPGGHRSGGARKP